jgi:5'/3'-nucleotidase SurE
MGKSDYVLLEGTPSTCTNVALHNLYPGEIDLVISGPNFGRNTSTAFTLSRYEGPITACLCHPSRASCRLKNRSP